MVLSEFSGKVLRNVSFTQKNGPPFPKGGPFLTLSRRSEYQCLSYYARPSAKALFIWFDLSPCRQDFESALEKSFLFFTRPSESAPSGAWVEGLIQAARCRTRCLTELLAPASGGLYSPGGLFSPNMSYLHI